MIFKNGSRESRIDFLLCSKRDLNEINNYKVLYREHVVKQHKMVVLDWEFESEKKGGLERKEWVIK